MARCSSTNLLETEELCEEGEEQSLEVDDEGNVSAEVRIWKECGGCGSEAKELTFTLEGSIDDQITDIEVPTIEAHKAACADFDLSVACGNWAVTDRFRTTDRHDERIANPRYQRRMVGVEGEVEVSCACGQTWTITLSDEDPASSMEDLGH